MTTKTYEPKCGLQEGDKIQFNQQNTCEVCGHQGVDVHEYPTYSAVLNRDTSEYQCDDIDACLNRKYAGTYMERVNA
jgi:ASC-1-like (ASCH) protein